MVIKVYVEKSDPTLFLPMRHIAKNKYTNSQILPISQFAYPQKYFKTSLV